MIKWIDGKYNSFSVTEKYVANCRQHDNMWYWEICNRNCQNYSVVGPHGFATTREQAKLLMEKIIDV